MSILFLGYFGKNNLGDDVYEYLWKNIYNIIGLSNNINDIGKYKIYIGNPNDVINIPEDLKIIIWGGGDIVNTYFFEKINKLLYGNNDFKNSNIHVYILGFGITYESIFKTGLLDYCDYFICRSKNDLNLLQNRYGGTYIKYMPDIAFLLKYVQQNKLDDIIMVKKKYNINANNKNIGIFLGNTIITDNNKYIVNEIGELINILLIEGIYHVYLLNFCTNEQNNNENDLKINKKIYEK